MADFAWGLLQCGHHVEVHSNAPYLQSEALAFAEVGPSGEPVDRRLVLKGSYQNGVSMITEPSQCAAIDRTNRSVVKDVFKAPWDGVLVGNIDLMGPEILSILNSTSAPILHHIGFMFPPFPSECFPEMHNYLLVAASQAVKASMQMHGLPVADAPVVYPGVRSQLFGDSARALTPALRFSQALHFSGHPLGSPSNPLKVGYAGLLMATKGAHTIIEALALLHRRCCSSGRLAGSEFQPGYQQLLHYLHKVGPRPSPVCWSAWTLCSRPILEFQHLVCSVQLLLRPLASLLLSYAALVTSAVGGAAELVPQVVMVRFTPGQSSALANVFQTL